MVDEWTRRAACRDQPHDWWFPEDRVGINEQRAKDICGTCPVRSECLEFALTTGQQYGIWGGLTEKQRRDQRKYRVIYCAVCGRRFPWLPSENAKYARAPVYCSGACRGAARRETQRRSYARAKASS